MIEQQPPTTSITPAEEVEASKIQRWPWGWRTVFRYLLVTLTLFAVGWMLWQSRTVLTPFIIGLVLAYLLLPLVTKLDKKLPRWGSILVVYAVGLGVFAGSMALIVPPAATQISEAVQSAPELYQAGREQVNRGVSWFNAEVPPEVKAQVDTQIDRVQQTVQQNASRYAQEAGNFVFSGVLSIFQTLTFLLGFLIIPFFLFYVLVDSKELPNALNRMLHPRIRADFWNVIRIIDTIFGKYIRGQLILGAIIGICSFVGLTVLKLLGFNVRFSVLLAIVAAIGELIPVVGPILSAIPAVLVGFTDSLQTGLWVAVLYIIIQQVENQVLVPRIVGNTLRLHAAVLMALLVIAAQLGGLGLVILIAPLAAIARDTFLYLHQRLLEPPISPAVAIQQVMEEPVTSQVPPKQIAKKA